MTASVRKHLGIWNALSVILTLACYFFYAALAAASQRGPEVIELSSTSSADEVSKARAAFANGDAIVRMIGASPADFERLLGVRAGEIKAFSNRNKTPGAGSSTQLKLQAIASYIDGKGIVRSVHSFAPDGEGWRKPMDEWIASEQSKAAGASVGDPEPPADAWTLLYSTTIQTGQDGNSAQSTDYVYRLNTISPADDFYMVYTVPQTRPNYTKIVPAVSVCDGISYCGWHTVERDFSISATSANGVAALIDHGPTGSITGSDVGFHIGAGLGPEGPGVDVGFSASWSQESVTTIDQSGSQIASWQERFQFNGDRCLPVVGTIPPVSSGTFLSRQGAIFQVPGGSSSFTTSITQQSLACLYVGPLWDYGGGNGKGAYYDWLTIQASFPLGAPVLHAHQDSLTIPAGGTAPLPVSAYIPNSDQGLQWTITSNQIWLTVPSKGPFTTGQVIPVTVAPKTADGTPGGTLSINTSPPFAAPSVTKGPILVNVSVGSPKASPVAGILLFGGLGEFATTAEFYDLASQAAVPVTPKVPRQALHTATLLNTGDILIAGGMTKVFPLEVTAAAELYQPPLFSFAPTTGKLATARAAHTATLLPDGKVLIVGGVGADGNSLKSAELYDPSNGTFSPAGELALARSYHSASLMRVGPGLPTQVVVYGGHTTDVVAPDDGWELWDEGKNAFVASGKMAAPVSDIPQPLAFYPPPFSSIVELAGGIGRDGVTNETQHLSISDIGSPNFSPGGNLQVPRYFHTLTALPNGEGMVTGGETDNGARLASAEITGVNEPWHLLSGTATCPGSPGCMLAPRANHTATSLPGGRVLLVGGNDSGPNTEFYDPVSKTFDEGPPLQSRTNHTATLVVTTATNLIATPPSSTFGQTVNLAASVTSAAGTPTGSVHFLDGSKELGSAELAQGQASFDVKTLSIGSHSLKAVYAGDGISNGSESAVIAQTVRGTTSSTSLALSPNPSQFGSAVTMTASVSATDGPVTGTVVFSDGGKQIANADLANGSATARVSDLGIGQHPITATYKGNENTQGSTSDTVTQVIKDELVTSTTLSSSNNPSTTGQSVTFRAKVNPVSGTGVPTGTVNFLDGSTLLRSADLVSGTASFTTSSLAEGTHAVVGMYLGDNNFSASTSSVLPQTVSSSGGGKVTPKVDLTVDGSTSSTISFGDTATFVARIHAAPGYPWPTGSITISDSTNSNNRYGSGDIRKDPNSNDGLAIIPNSGIGVGGYTLVATYGGDNEDKYYNGARSNTVSLTVKPKLGGPPPQPSLAISGTAGARDGRMLLVSLTLTNNGRATARDITLNQIALRTLAGSEEAELFAPSLPVIVGELEPGESTVVTLELQFPTTIRKLALSEHGTFRNARGTVYHFSPGQVVVP